LPTKKRLKFTVGCAASGGASAPETPRATRNQPESIRIFSPLEKLDEAVSIRIFVGPEVETKFAAARPVDPSSHTSQKVEPAQTGKWEENWQEGTPAMDLNSWTLDPGVMPKLPNAGSRINIAPPSRSFFHQRIFKNRHICRFCFVFE